MFRRRLGLLTLLLTTALLSVSLGLDSPLAQAKPQLPSLADQIFAQLGPLERPGVAQTTETTGLHVVPMQPVEPEEVGAGPAAVMAPDAGPAGSGPLGANPAGPASRLGLDRSAGPAGSRIRLSGAGYAPGEPVRIFWGQTEISAPRAPEADSAGGFTATLSVPADAAPGVYTIAAIEASVKGLATALDGALEQSTASFTVTAGEETASSSPAPLVEQGRATPQATKDWTFVVYMAGDISDDSNLDRRGFDNLISMSLSGGATSRVNIVALADLRGRATQYLEVRESSSGGLLVDVTPSTIAGRNLNTGDPQPFIDFMGFVGQYYPAQHYALVLWSHGDGWRGVQSDDTANAIWSMGELRSALGSGLQRLGASRYDLVIMDACFMAQYEVALEIGDFANLLVASEEEVRSAGLPYRQILGRLRGDPAQSAESFATAIVEAYSSFYGPSGPEDWPEYTVSAIRLSSLATLKARMDAFATQLVGVSRTQGGELTLRARQRTKSYRDPDFIDLGSFAASVLDNDAISDQAVKDTARALLTTIQSSEVIIHKANGRRAAESTGISVYFPEDPGKGLRKRPTSITAVPATAIASGYEQLRVSSTPWYALLVGLDQGSYPDLTLPPLAGDLPAVPPPAAASEQDVLFSVAVNSREAALYRLGSADPSETPLKLLADGYINLFPRWSPNGRVVAYLSNRPAAGASTSGVERNLFLTRADGLGEPLALTKYGVDCPDGPGRNERCLVSQVSAPNWLTDGSGLLYTVITYDFAAYPSYSTRQAIHVVSPDGAIDLAVLPNKSLGVNDDLQFTNGDLKAENGIIKYLLFSYRAEANAPYNPDFRNNTFGVLDFTTSSLGPEDVSGFTINPQHWSTPGGSYLLVDFPAWRPGTNDIVFLYNRRGYPAFLSNTDLRVPPVAGVWERTNPYYPFYGPPFYPTADMGIMTFEWLGLNKYRLTNARAILTDSGARYGRGVNFHPGWRPVPSSRDLATSYSFDGGYSYDVALFTGIGTAGQKLYTVTNNGSSFVPSWGSVTEADVRARLAVSPRFVEPGPSSSFYLQGRGFPPDEQVRISEVTAEGEREVATARADSSGGFTVQLPMPSGSQPRSFIARSGQGLAQGSKVSNTDVVIPLLRRAGGLGTSVYLPALRR